MLRHPPLSHGRRHPESEDMMKTWDERIDEVWDDASGEEVGEETIARIDALAAERGLDDARAQFERAGARAVSYTHLTLPTKA